MNGMALATCWPFSLDDPYPGLERLRERAAVHWLRPLGAHLVVSNALAAEVLHGPGWSADPSLSPHLTSRLPAGPGNDLPAKFLLFSDPPSHSRLRRAVSGWLTPRAVESSRRHIARFPRCRRFRPPGLLSRRS